MIFFLVFSQALLKSRNLRENGKYIPKQAFLARKDFLLRKEGTITKGKEKVGQVNKKFL